MIERRTRANARSSNALITLVALLLSGPAFAQSFRAAATFTAGAQPYALVVADFNDDTRPDLALAVSGANAVA
ncbi:MAG TPA: hypothetical protein VMV21_05970, partial [Vicinamibacteria bacterium]|nr:hypothetical protein [Vicinamibacteria bacterium]